MGLELYLDLLSQPCRAVYIFAKKNGIPFQMHTVDIIKGQNLSEQFSQLNCLRKLPVLKDGSFVLTESSAILIYLSSKYQVADHWYPTDLQAHAQVHEYLGWHANNIRSTFGVLLWTKVLGPLIGIQVPEEKVERNRKNMSAALQLLEEKFLGDRAFLVGQQITLADLMCLEEMMQRAMLLLMLPPVPFMLFVRKEHCQQRNSMNNSMLMQRLYSKNFMYPGKKRDKLSLIAMIVHSSKLNRPLASIPEDLRLSKYGKWMLHTSQNLVPLNMYMYLWIPIQESFMPPLRREKKDAMLLHIAWMPDAPPIKLPGQIGYTTTGCSNDGVTPRFNITYGPTPVCVYPPFLFIVSKEEPSTCLNVTCFYAQCWNTSEYGYAVIARLPRWVPVPVEAPSSLTLFRQKRDFGITAGIIATITAAAVGATTAAIAMSHSVQTAHVLNNLSQATTEALDKVSSINNQLKGGLMIVNQRIDLIQEQIDTLWQLAQLGCEWKMPGLCVTSVQYQNYSRAANLSKSLSSYLLGNWTGEFDRMMAQLRMSIVMVNSTRVDPGLANGLTSWIITAMSHLKEWAGLGALSAIMVLIFVLCLWCLCRFRSQQRRTVAMLAQAFAALEAGEPAQVWLATLRPGKTH
ncbi:hypothetical protein STEG23_013419 [Scotinomys teguina]